MTLARAFFRSGLLLLAILLTSPAPAKAAFDLHWLWHNQCYECHGHAGDFARKYLTVDKGELQGWHHVHDLRRFLQHHYLAPDDVDGVYQMLLAQAATPPRFKEACTGCHGTAADFVRTTLELRNGVLYSRTAGTPVHDVDRKSSRCALQPADVAFFLQQLTRVAHEVFQPVTAQQH